MKNGKYDDIINLPHHRSNKRAHMSMSDRAAQFAPFAALTGHGAAIAETARLTETKPDIDDGVREVISGKLGEIKSKEKSEPVVLISYFIPDKKKSGGMCVTKRGAVKKIDEYKQALAMADETVIPFENILNLEIDDSLK